MYSSWPQYQIYMSGKQSQAVTSRNNIIWKNVFVSMSKNFFFRRSTDLSHKVLMLLYLHSRLLWRIFLHMYQSSSSWLSQQHEFSKQQEENPSSENSSTKIVLSQWNQPSPSNCLPEKSFKTDLVKSRTRTKIWHWKDFDDSFEAKITRKHLQVKTQAVKPN